MSEMFKDLEVAFGIWGIVSVISVPLAIWKLVDIIIWIVKHIDIIVK